MFYQMGCFSQMKESKSILEISWQKILNLLKDMIFSLLYMTFHKANNPKQSEKNKWLSTSLWVATWKSLEITKYPAHFHRSHVITDDSM